MILSRKECMPYEIIFGTHDISPNQDLVFKDDNILTEIYRMKKILLCLFSSKCVCGDPLTSQIHFQCHQNIFPQKNCICCYDSILKWNCLFCKRIQLLNQLCMQRNDSFSLLTHSQVTKFWFLNNADIKQFIVVSKLNDDLKFRITYKYDFAFEYIRPRFF